MKTRLTIFLIAIIASADLAKSNDIDYQGAKMKEIKEIIYSSSRERATDSSGTSSENRSGISELKVFTGWKSEKAGVFPKFLVKIENPTRRKAELSLPARRICHSFAGENGFPIDTPSVNFAPRCVRSGNAKNSYSAHRKAESATINGTDPNIDGEKFELNPNDAVVFEFSCTDPLIESIIKHFARRKIGSEPLIARTSLIIRSAEGTPSYRHFFSEAIEVPYETIAR